VTTLDLLLPTEILLYLFPKYKQLQKSMDVIKL